MSADNKTPLFNEYKKAEAIVLVDSSGSTRNNYNQQLTIFDKIQDVVKNLGHDNYRCIFWNSPNQTIERFKTGTFVLPFVVKKETLAVTFKIVKDTITDDCLTSPHFAFAVHPPLVSAWHHNLLSSFQFAAECCG